jgi:HSP20 family molecular chaperone IbpA
MTNFSESGTVELALTPTTDDLWDLDGCFGPRYGPFGLSLARTFPWGAIAGPNRTDIIDRGDAYELVVELPGVPKDQVTIHLKGQELSIHAEPGAAGSESSERYVLRERRPSVYDRRFELAEPVAASTIEAKLDAGVLTVRIPKPKPVPEETIPVAGPA